MLTDFVLQGLLFGIVHNLGAHLAAAFQDSENGHFVFPASPGDFLFALVGVHVTRLAADEGFIRFNLSREFIDGPHRQSKPDAVIEEPSGLLGDADGAMNFVGTDAVFAVHNLPHRREPLVQAERGVFHDGSGLQRELRGAVLLPAVPAVVLLQKQHVLTAAARTGNAVRPSARYEVLPAVDRIGEVDYGFLKAFGFGGGFHVLSMAEAAHFVKYIIALFCTPSKNGI